MSGEFTIEYVELPNERVPAREFVDSLDDKAAARIDAFVERLRIYGNRMQGKFVKKPTDDIFELRVKQFDRIFRVLVFYQPGMLIVITSGFQKKTAQTQQGEISRAGQLNKALDELPKPLYGITEGKRSYPEGVGTMKCDKHSEIVERRARKSATTALRRALCRRYRNRPAGSVCRRKSGPASRLLEHGIREPLVGPKQSDGEAGSGSDHRIEGHRAASAGSRGACLGPLMLPRACLSVTGTQLLVDFCFDCDDAQALVVACQRQDIGMRCGFTALQAHLPFGNRGKKSETLQRFVTR